MWFWSLNLSVESSSLSYSSEFVPDQGKGTELSSTDIVGPRLPQSRTKTGSQSRLAQGVLGGGESLEDGSMRPRAEHLQGPLGCQFNHRLIYQMIQF